MECVNKTLDNYNKMLYFIKGKPTSLGRLNKDELREIRDHLTTYPEGLLNGYSKYLYVEAVKYILKWRKDDKYHIPFIIESYRLQKAEKKADLLTKVIFNSLIKTEQQYNKKLIFN